MPKNVKITLKVLITNRASEANPSHTMQCQPQNLDISYLKQVETLSKSKKILI